MDFIKYFLTAFYAITPIEAVPWDGPQSTSSSLSSSPGSNPKTTLGLRVGTETALLHSNNLRRRQARGSVCGYFSDELGNTTTVSCGDTISPICSPISSLSAIGCCNEWGGNQCFVFTDCLGYYAYSILCSLSTVPCSSGLVCNITSAHCASDVYKQTCGSSSPFCRRFAQSGYSVFACDTFHAVHSVSMTFFSPSPRTETKISTSTSLSTPTAISLSTSTATSCANNNCRTVSPGLIAGSVVGGLFILVAGVVGIAFMLQQAWQTPPVPPPIDAMDNPSSPGSEEPAMGELAAPDRFQLPS